MVGLVCVCAFALLAVSSSFALAAETRPYTGVSFGPDGAGGTEAFENTQSVAIDQASGAIFVYDAAAGKVYKFDAAGEPVDFASTGTNAIEGIGGPFEEGAEQVAVAPAGSPGGTAGDIYVANNEIVKVFASTGVELGQLGEGETCGVAVDPAGHLFIGSYPKIIREYAPAANPSDDIVIHERNFAGEEVAAFCNVASDGLGNVYAAAYSGGSVAKVAWPSAKPGTIEPGGSTIGVDPADDDLYIDTGERVEWYDSETNLVGTLGFGQLTESHGLAVGPAADEVYVGDMGSGKVKVFGAPVPTPTLAVVAATNLAGGKATLNGSVDPNGQQVTACEFEYGTGGSFGQSEPCAALPPTNSEPDAVSADISGLEPNGVEYNFRLAVTTAGGIELSAAGTFISGATVITEPATMNGLEAATLDGTVFPEGLPYSACEFEYGLLTEAGLPDKADCVPSAGSIPLNFAPNKVSAELSGLEANDATYRFRLSATNANGTVVGKTLTFTTSGEPTISEARASDANQGSATLEATIDPHGFATSYRIEWGPTSSYGNIAASGSIGPAEGPDHLSTPVAGLTPGTLYHYRVVAENEAGPPVASSDLEFETLNSCGLANGRCLEMVSPPGLRQVGLPQQQTAGLELTSQAAEVPGRMAFETELGSPPNAAGGESLYLSDRGPAGWQSNQYTPSTTGSVSGGNLRSRVLGLSADLDCSVIASSLPLTEDPVGLAVEREGGANLYRRGAAGDYTLITDLPPSEGGSGGGPTHAYTLAGMSPDCRRVVFSTSLRYPGIPGEGSTRLYEWNEGTLHNVGCVPSENAEPLEESKCVAAGEAVAEVSLGNSEPTFREANVFDAVSTDGARIFFTAISHAGNDKGDSAVFVRIDGSETLDVSQSPLAPDIEAEFQGATPDGSRVYFTANAGLTPSSSPSGRDLYECRIVEVDAGGTGKHECKLTDLSVGTTGEPAEAGGEVESEKIGALVAVSDSGSRVYFIARGQLVSGEGASGAQIGADETLSLYLYEVATKSIRYVGAIGDDSKNEALSSLTTGKTLYYTSRTSPDGRYLLFESIADVNGYDSGGAPMVYLFDAEAANAAEALTCVSCRQDGRPGVGALDPEFQPALNFPGTQSPTYLAHSLVVRDGRPVVFFRSRDPLAPGATEGEWSLYEWSHHQVFQIAPDLGRGGSEADPHFSQTLQFVGASSEGIDLYFVGSTALNWEDPDARRAVWDARVGGGFAEPTPAPVCDPGSEGSCQGPAPSTPPSAAPGTTAAGTGNMKSKPKKKHHKKKHHKKKRRKGSTANARHANANGRAGK